MGHSHQHAHGHAGAKHRWRLAAAFGLVTTFMAVELAAGLWANSLALISDAGHMSADAVALGAALLATRIATRRDTSGRRTFGYYRAEVFASGFTVLLMLAVAGYVCVEAFGRRGSEADVDIATMAWVGALGLAVNVVCVLLLRAGAAESMNVKAAYFEVVADAVGSVAVMLGAVLIAVTGEARWDVVVAVLLAAFVAVRAVVLGREVLAVLAQHAPSGVDVEEVLRGLGALPGVREVHDVHVWSLTSGMHVATAHLVVQDAADPAGALVAAQELLRESHGIAHATIQVETQPSQQCHEVNW